MKPYIDDEVIEKLDDSYASQPSIESVPEKPDDDSYHEGVTPLDTLPAPWWNWFIQNFLKAEARTSDAIVDIYTELKAILSEAEIDADSDTHNQLLQGIRGIIVSDVGDRVTELETDTIALEGRATALEGDTTSLAGRVTTLEDESASSSDVAALTGRVVTLEGTVAGLVSRVEALETWKGGLSASNFEITGAWTCPTPTIP